METKLKILFVEDVLADAELNWRELDKNGIAFERLLVDNRKDFLEGLDSFKPDVIISDYSMPQFDGMKALLLRNEKAPLTPFILVTGSNNETVAVECIKAGADDYILKDNLSRLSPAINNSVRRFELLKQKKDAENALLESEERFRILYNEAIVGLYRTNLKGEIIQANHALVNMLGFKSFQDLAARNLKDSGYGPSYERQQFIDQIERYGVVKDLEAIWICKDGSEIFVKESAKAIYDSDGEILFYDGSVQNITEQKQATEAFKKVQHLFETLTLVSPVGIFKTNPDGHTTYVNPKWLELSGLTTEEAMGIGWLNAVHPDDRENLEVGWKSNVKSKKPSIAEYRFLRPDGSIVWVLGNALPDMINSEIIGYIGTVTNITEHKLAEETIIHERILLRTLIDNLPDPIYVMDNKSRKVIANIADVKNIGYRSEDEILGKTDIELFPGEIGLRGHEDNENIISSGKAVIGREEDFIDANGKRRWLETTKIPLKDKDGKITGLVGVGHDITERKRAEEELHHSFLFNESLLRTIPFAMHIVDESGSVLYQNDIFNILFENEGIGKKCWELYRDDKTQCGGCPLKKGISVGESDSYESSGVLNKRIFEISHTGMMYQGKKAMLEIFQDITLKKQSEVELIHAKDKAEESDRLKTAFLHNISHEIRTPMNAIVGFSALLREPGLDAQTQQSYIETIEQSSNHLLSIITDIIDISNIEANIVKITRNGINVNTTLNSIYNQFQLKAAEKKIKLSNESRLSDSEALVLSDNTKLTQILTNLVNNAIKFTDEGNIKLSCRIADSFLEFSVTDTGIGIPGEHHSRIFERFYQVKDSMSRLYEGTGLGLPISKAYVDLMDGKIWLTSEPGKGTTFYFTLPYEKVPVEETSKVYKLVPEVLDFKKKKKILVAEDVDSNFMLIQYFLSGANTAILRASNGKEAVDMALAEKGIDLILMDIKMPKMDGYEAVRLIREAKIKIPIIAQTAYADDTEKAIECGCSSLISKPFDKKTLLKAMSEFI